jgi:hypothetical protein
MMSITDKRFLNRKHAEYEAPNETTAAHGL